MPVRTSSLAAAAATLLLLAGLLVGCGASSTTPPLGTATGGSAAIGSTTGGSGAGGSVAGDSAAGGSSGSATGGSTVPGVAPSGGGSAGGGSAAGGSAGGGSAGGGSAGGGSAVTKPTVAVPDGPPPTQLVSKDLIVGTGPVATPGQTVSVQYVGVAYSTKKQFDASWDRGQPFDFPLGGGQVIKGWDQGVPGMKVGGRRELIIPPDLAYGANSPSPDIKPGETLVFVIDLVKAG